MRTAKDTIIVNVNTEAIRRRLDPCPDFMNINRKRRVSDADVAEALQFIGMEPGPDLATWYGDEGALMCLMPGEVRTPEDTDGA